MFGCIFILQILKDKAQSRLKTAADKHWSDGALEVFLLSLKFELLFVYCILMHIVGNQAGRANLNLLVLSMFHVLCSFQDLPFAFTNLIFIFYTLQMGLVCAVFL